MEKQKLENYWCHICEMRIQLDSNQNTPICPLCQKDIIELEHSYLQNQQDAPIWVSPAITENNNFRRNYQMFFPFVNQQTDSMGRMFVRVISRLYTGEEKPVSTPKESIDAMVELILDSDSTEITESMSCGVC